MKNTILILILLMCLSLGATELKLPNGGGGITYYGEYSTNITANASITNQIDSPLRSQSFTTQFFYTPVGTNSSQLFLDQSCDLGTNWINVYSNTITGTNSFQYVATNKFSSLRVRLTAGTTNLNWYFAHIAQ